jgi:hypothetical protein
MYALAIQALPANPAAPLPPWYLWATERGVRTWFEWAAADAAGQELRDGGRYDYRVVGLPVIAVEPDELPAY